MKGIQITVGFALAFWGIISPLPAFGQSVVATIDLDDSDPGGIFDNPFGLTLAPDGRHVLVAIAGGFDDPNTPMSENNQRVDIIDLDTLSVVGSLDTGFFPEEIAIRSDGAQNVERIYVTNSSDSTVSVFESLTNPTPVATLSLPGFSFPFGLVLSPSQDRLYVGTGGGQGEIHVFDTDPLSLNFETELTPINVPGGHGRLCFDGPDRLVVPHSVLAGDFSHSDAFLTVLDPANPASRDTIQLAAGGNFEYPSIQDCVVTSAGLAYMALFSGSDDIYVIDVRTMNLNTTIDLGPLAENLQHGIGMRAGEDYLLVTNFVQSTVSLVDMNTNSVLADVPVGNEPNDAIFIGDDSLALVTNQNSFSVSVIGDLPLPSVELSGPAFPSLLDSVSFEVSGGEFAQPVRLLLSTRGNDLTPFENVQVNLSAPIKTRFNGSFDRFGTVSTPGAQIPNVPGLVGRTFYLQTVTTFSQGTQVASNPFAVVVQP